MVCLLAIFLALGALPDGASAAAHPKAPHGPSEILWVPTLEQGLLMARETGRPLFLMGYSLVPDGTTYTKLGEEYCSGVF
jgi:hypothetical protein